MTPRLLAARGPAPPHSSRCGWSSTDETAHLGAGQDGHRHRLGHDGPAGVEVVEHLLEATCRSSRTLLRPASIYGPDVRPRAIRRHGRWRDGHLPAATPAAR